MFNFLSLCFYDIYLLTNKLIMDLVNWIVYFYHKNIQRTSYILPKINKSPRYSPFICPYVKSQDTKMRCMGQATNTVGLQKKSNDLKYTSLGREPVSIVHYTRPGPSFKR